MIRKIVGIAFLGLVFGFIGASLMARAELPGPAIPDSLGVAVNFNSPKYNPGQDCRSFQALADAGFKWVRFVPDWQYIEKEPGVYDFTIPDWMVSEFEVRGVKPILGLGLNNPLYGVNTRIRTAEQRTAFAAYVRALVRHYKGRVGVYEIWNEPNISSFWKPLSGETLTMSDAVNEYLAVVDAVMPVIREEDPEAKVIAPGAANYNTPWMQLALGRGLLARVDALSAHPYQGINRPELLIAQHNAVYGWTPVADRGKPIVFTEWGYSTGTGSTEVSEATQARYLKRSALLAMMLGIRGSFVYNLANESLGEPCTSQKACFGLISRVSQTPKPALAAMAAMITALDGYTYADRFAYGSKPTVYALRFTRPDSPDKWAVWNSTDGVTQTVTLPTGLPVTATDDPAVY